MPLNAVHSLPKRQYMGTVGLLTAGFVLCICRNLSALIVLSLCQAEQKKGDWEGEERRVANAEGS